MQEEETTLTASKDGGGEFNGWWFERFFMKSFNDVPHRLDPLHDGVDEV